MTSAGSKTEIFDQAAEEGRDRLDQSRLELASTSFIAGFTVVFGVVALGIVEAAVETQFGELARVAGALAFGVGVVFLVAGRVELFNENFFDPAAAAVEADSWLLGSLVRLWVLTLVFNVAGGFLFALVFTVEGAVPAGATEALATFAEESAHRPTRAWFASSVAGGALVALLSYLLVAVDGEGSKLSLAYVVGVLLAIGPLDHVVVTAIHLFLGVLFGASVDPVALAGMLAVVTAGNLVGGLGLTTLTHVTQVIGAESSGD